VGIDSFIELCEDARTKKSSHNSHYFAVNQVSESYLDLLEKDVLEGTHPGAAFRLQSFLPIV
jgi:hypothetical protein